MSVEQSGNVTPGHLAKWVTDNVLADAGAAPTAAPKVIAALKNANFNDTNDQPIVIPAEITAFAITAVIVTNASVSLTTAAGGIYSAAGKTGTQILLNSTVYSALTGPTVLLTPSVTAQALATRWSVANLPNNYSLYFSLTTPQGAAAVADIYIIGIDLTL